MELAHRLILLIFLSITPWGNEFILKILHLWQQNTLEIWAEWVKFTFWKMSISCSRWCTYGYSNNCINRYQLFSLLHLFYSFKKKKQNKTPMGKDNEGSEKAIPNPLFHWCLETKIFWHSIFQCPLFNLPPWKIWTQSLCFLVLCRLTYRLCFDKCPMS